MRKGEVKVAVFAPREHQQIADFLAQVEFVQALEVDRRIFFLYRGDFRLGDRDELPTDFKLEDELDRIEKIFILKALNSANNVKTKAALLLGLTLKEFNFRLQRHGISTK